MDNTIVLPFKPGDDIWWIDSDTMEVRCEKNGIAAVAIYADRIEMIDKAGEHWSLGEQWFFLTKESAEEFRDAMLKDKPALICPHCQSDLQGDWRYCPSCGTLLKE